MAVTDFDKVTAVTREKILPGVIDQVSNSHPLLSRLLDGSKRKDGGHRIDATIKYVNSTQGGSYSGLETLSVEEEQTKTRAYWDWKQYEMPLGISNIDIAKNGGSSKVIDLVGQALEEIEIDLKQLMAGSNHGIHADGTGNDNKDITGLVAAVDDGTNIDTYGDISRSSYSWWKSDYTASGGDLSLSTMATTFDNVTSGDDEPSLIATTKSLWSSYEALLQPQIRYGIDSGQSDIEIEGGFKALMYRGAPIVRDEFCSSGYMYFLNEDYIQMVTLDHPDFKTDNKGFAMTDLVRPDNQDGKMGYILWYGNLINTQPRRSGVIRGLS